MEDPAHKRAPPDRRQMPQGGRAPITHRVADALRQHLDWVGQDRHWWHDAEPTFVLWVIAGRAFLLCVTLLVMATAVTFYTTRGRWGGADALITLMVLFALYLMVLSARRAGEASALWWMRDADPGEAPPPRVRALLLVVAVAAIAGLVCSGYALVQQRLGEVAWADQPRTFVLRVGGLLFLDAYLAIAATRAFAQLVATPPFYQPLIDRVRSERWRWLKDWWALRD